jgi:hypothetical protein
VVTAVRSPPETETRISGPVVFGATRMTPLGPPRRAPAGGSRSQRQRRARAEVQSFQRSPGQESDGAAVGRPEGIFGTFSTAERLRRRRCQGTQPQARRTIARGHVDDVPPIRREREGRQVAGRGENVGARLSRRRGRPLTQVAHGWDRHCRNHCGRECQRSGRPGGTPRRRTDRTDWCRLRAGGRPEHRLLDIQADVAGVGDPPSPILLETAAEQPPDRGRRLTWQQGPIGIALEHRRQHV